MEGTGPMMTHAAGSARLAGGAGRRRINVGPVERWASIIGGLALLARGVTRYCPAKASLTGLASRTDLNGGLRGKTAAGDSDAAAITSMDALYVAELQELHSADTQLLALLPKVSRALSGSAAAERLKAYADELASQRQRLDAILRDRGADPRQHPDDAMRALARETEKMLGVGGQRQLRDAALIASVQRIIHYRIATLGTVAAYAKTLGREAEAASLAAFADNEKAIDAVLTDLAKDVTNPAAARSGPTA